MMKKLYDKTPGFVKFLMYAPLITCVVFFVIGLVKSIDSMFWWSLGIGLVWLCIIGAIDSYTDKKYTAEYPYERLTQPEKEEVREKYIASLTIGDEKVDKLLREYAELRYYTDINSLGSILRY